MAKTKSDYVRDYLEDVAKTARDLNVIRTMLKQRDVDWQSEHLLETKAKYEEQLKAAEETIGQLEGIDGYALICRYVYLMGDAKMIRTLGYSRSSVYRILERGIKAFYDYLPDEYKKPGNLGRK